MKSLSLCIILMYTAILANTQTLSGKFVYSHHNRFVSSNADSIYSLTSTGQRKFITLGFDAKVSPSGTYMAFENGPSYSSLRANVWMRNLTTKKDSEIVVNSNDYLNYFDFYSSEAQIVYAQSCNIYTSNVNGANNYTFLLCTPCDCFSDDPQIRYSDNKILYHNQHYGIYTCNSNGSNPQKFTTTIPGDMYPTWSPDGGKIAFLKTSLNNNVYKINVATGDTTQLTFFTSPDTIWANPNFSQSGKSVYFIARIKSKPGIYKVNASGNGHYSLVYAFYDEGSIYDYFLGKSNTTTSILLNADNKTAIASNSLAKNEIKPSVTVYPNPAYNKTIHLQLNNISTGTYSIIVYSMNGGTLYRKGFQQTNGNTSLTLYLKNTAAGIYKIEMKNNSNSYHTTVILQ